MIKTGATASITARARKNQFFFVDFILSSIVMFNPHYRPNIGASNDPILSVYCYSVKLRLRLLKIRFNMCYAIVFARILKVYFCSRIRYWLKEN
jgi:hypothetical protein